MQSLEDNPDSLELTEYKLTINAETGGALRREVLTCMGPKLRLLPVHLKVTNLVVGLAMESQTLMNHPL